MQARAMRRRGAAAAATIRVPRPTTDLSRFKPETATAGPKVAFMIQRGATVIHVTERMVKIAHAGRTARIDAVGRVNWDL